MAGAGKRTFIAGEVLTAAQVNDYLMDQAVMRFSGSAARAASITAPTEGMHTYLDDSDSLEFYDGANWVRADATRLFTAKGDLVTASGPQAGYVLPVGTDGQVLTAASTETAGFRWQTPAAGGANTIGVIAEAATGSTVTGSVEIPAGYYALNGNTLSSASSNNTITASQIALNVGSASYALTNNLIEVSASAASAGFTAIPPALFTASPGEVWNGQTVLSGQYTGINTFGSGSFLVAVGTELYLSTNGVTWTSRTNPNPGNTPTALGFGNSRFLAGFNSGSVFTSTDCVTWTGGLAQSSGDIRRIVYGNGRYVATGTGGSKGWQSSNGTTWTSISFPSDFGESKTSLDFGNGIFLVTGTSSSTRAWTSTDGVTWTSRTKGSSTAPVYGLRFGNGIFVGGLSAGKVITTTDGVTWNDPSTGAGGNIQSVAADTDNGRWVAVGDNIAISTDTVTWTTRARPSGSYYENYLSYGNSRFLLSSNTTTAGAQVFISPEVYSPDYITAIFTPVVVPFNV